MADQKNNSAAPAKKESLISTLVSNPQVMNAFGEKLQSMAGQKSEFIAFLPACMKRRLKALKKLQLQVFGIEGDFFEEVNKLECKFASLYQPIFDKRRDITSATHEPTDDECDFDEEEEEKDETTPTPASVFPEDTAGVPEFWLTIFKNVSCISQLISDEDEEALKKLTDVRVSYLAGGGFELLFDFSENDIFTQTTLTKKYDMRIAPDPKHTMTYEGPEIVKCHGGEVGWKEGKSLLVDKEGARKDSFFHFFSPPVVAESMEEGEAKEKMEDDLLEDYDIGQLLQSSIIPKAVLYYTGEAVDGDDDDLDCDDEGEDDDENDPDYKPSKGDKSDCKQQ